MSHYSSVETAGSSTDADWHDWGCRQKAAPSHLPSPCPLSARVWYVSIFFSSTSSLEKLNKIQYATLCLCRRAMKSSLHLHFVFSIPVMNSAPY